MFIKKINAKIREIVDSPKTFFVIFLLILISIAVPLVRNINNRHRINQEIKNLEAEVKLTENKNGDLNKLIAYLESDQYLEGQARMNMGLKKDGEEVVVVKGLENRIVKTDVSTESDSPFSVPGLDVNRVGGTDSNPKKWLKYFIK
ncbi:MAG: septum formation initiator family protein [bacterium]